jgi:hypothetical protein
MTNVNERGTACSLPLFSRQLLAAGGKYGIHELCFRPDGMSEAKCREIEAEMSKEIHIEAQPLCSSEWRQPFEQEGSGQSGTGRPFLQPSDQMALNGMRHRLKPIMSSEFLVDVVEMIA